MVITSWLAALTNNLFGKKKVTLKRKARSGVAPLQAPEALETRALLTATANNDSYTFTEDQTFTVSNSAQGVLANDSSGNGTRNAVLDNDTSNGDVDLNSNGTFTFTPSSSLNYLNDGESVTRTFTYYINDQSSGSQNSNIATVTLTINGRNDQLDVSDLNSSGSEQTFSYTEDASSVNLYHSQSQDRMTVTDPDTGDQITVTLLMSDKNAGTLASGGNGSYNSSTGVYTYTGTASQVTSVLAALKYTPSANYNSDFSINVSIADGGENSTVPVTGKIVVNGTAVNDEPSFTVGGAQTVLEDAGAQTVPGFISTYSAGPANESSQAVDFEITNNTNSSLFSSQPSISANGTLTYTPAANANGTATISVRIHDDGGTSGAGDNRSDTQTFTITVTTVNDVPSFNVQASDTSNEDAGARSVSGFASSISKGASNESGQAVDFIVSNDNNSLFSAQPTIAANGTLTYTAAPNQYGTATVTVQIHDDGGTSNGGVDTSASKTFTITINPINDAPSFTVGGNQSADEDASTQSVDGFISTFSAGPNESQTIDFIVTNSDNSLFSTQPAIDANGNLTYTPAANAYGTATVTVQIHDNGGTSGGGADTSATQTFTITLNPINDVPSFDVQVGHTSDEDAGARSVSGFVSNISKGADNESGQTVDFIVTNDNNSLFSSQPTIAADGTLTYTAAPDQYGTATVTVQIHDDGGTSNGGVDTSATKTFIITILPINDVPSFDIEATETSNEDAGPQSIDDFAFNISAGPTNESTQAVDFIVTNDNNSLFSAQPTINPDGTLTYTAAPNANGTATVSVQIHDDGGTEDGVDTSTIKTITITINAVNDVPSFNVQPSHTSNEDAGAQSIDEFAGNISTGPTDEVGQAVDFIVTNDNNSLFSSQPAIDADGKLTYTAAPNANGTATVTVQIHDNGGTSNGGVDTSTTQTFTITINAVNDIPSFNVQASHTSNEDAGAQSIDDFASNISAGPTNEVGQAVDFIVTNDNNGLFSSQPAIDADGNLTYTAAPNANGTATVTVKIHDNGGTSNGGVDTSTTQTFTITINAVNDVPSFNVQASHTSNEDAGAQSIDEFAGNISTGPTDEVGQAVDFIVTNDNNSLFSSQPTIDADGKLTYTAAPNANGTATVTVKIHDNGGTSNDGVDTSTTQTFTITINAVNDVPSFDVQASHLSSEDAGPQSIDDFATNISAGPTNEVGQAVDFIVTNDNNGLFSSQPTINADGTLTYTAAPNANGTATVTVKIHDNGGTSNGGVDTSTTQTFTISVYPVNDVPSFNVPADHTSNEDAGAQSIDDFATNISAGPADEVGQAVDFIVTNDNNSLFSSQPTIDADGNLTYTAAPDASGTATVTVKIHDNGGTTPNGVDTSTTQTFTITINPVNDAPSFNVQASHLSGEDAGPQSIDDFATNISAGPTDEVGQAVDFIVTNDNNGLFSSQPTINADGTLTYTAAPNANGTATVTVKIHDNGGTSNGGVDTSTTQTFTISVYPVNDVPSFNVPADHTSNEDAGAQSIDDFATNISAGPADESGQAVDFIVTNDNNGLFSSQPTIDADGNLTYTAAPNANGTATVTVKIHDNGGTTPNGVDTSTTQTFTITINAVNDAPSFTVGGNQSSNEDAGAQSVTEFIDNFSTGPADESGQIVNYIVTNDNNSLFSSQPTIDANGNLTYTAAPNANGTAIVSVKIHDNGGTSNGGVDTSAIQTFTITINAVDDAPVANDATFSLNETATVGTVVGTATATDPDSGDTKTFAITGGNTGNTFAIDPATGVITVLSTAALNFDVNPTFSLQITVTDGDSLTDTATVTVNLTRQSYVLEVHLPSDPATFYIRHGETVIDPAANAYDLDNPLIDYRGGQLSIRITTNAQGNDRLSIISQGTGAGQISVKGKDVSYGGVIIGRITQPGTGLKALTITFNNNVTEAAANALMKVVAYKSTVTSPSVAPRTVTFTIQNAADTEHASSSIIVNVSRSAPARGIQVGAGPVSYNSGTGAVAIAPAGTVISPANLDFNGARLKVDITSGSNSQNRLGINNVGGITVVGKNVLFNGNTIGTATLGNNSLTIKLSSVYATPEAVQALVRAISFSTTAANTNLVNRVASFTLTDVNGVASPRVTQTIQLAPQ